ncbi:MAG: FMN-binding protein [Clostridia bacterium]|nr:FMN-binding protein [Clostridia bacterium]
MKNNMIKSIVVLTAICLVVSAALAVTNHFTKPIIDAAAAEAARAALFEIFPDAEDFEKLVGREVPASVKSVYRETSGKGFVIELAAVGYGGGASPIAMVVGLDNEGKILKTVIVSCSGETPGKGDVIMGEDFLSQFVGKDETLNGVSAVSGATISSAAVIDAVRDAFLAYKEVLK